MEMRGWNIEKMAEILGVSLNELNVIILEKQAFTVSFAEKLAKVFNTSSQYWTNLDSDYRIWVEQRNNLNFKPTEFDRFKNNNDNYGEGAK
jgi:addiction module HigA family antidote